MKTLLLFVVLVVLKLASASITLDFNLNGDETATRMFEFLDVATTTNVSDVNSSAPVFSVASSSTPLTEATGSLKVTITGKSLSDGGENALMWSFGPDANIHSNTNGIGVKSPGDTNARNQLADGEAFLLSFDLSNLKIQKDSILVFTVLGDSGESFRIYRRTGANDGQVATSVGSVSPAVPSNPISVVSRYSAAQDVYEYAIADPGWNGGGLVRVKSLSIDSMTRVPTAAPVSASASPFGIASTSPPSTSPASTSPPSTSPASTSPPSTSPPSTSPPATSPPATSPPATSPPSQSPLKRPTSTPTLTRSVTPSQAPILTPTTPAPTVTPTIAPTPGLPSTLNQIILDFNSAGDENVTKTFRYTNVGSTSPRVSDIGAKTACFTINPSSENLAGASGSLTVTWTGKDKAGNLENATVWKFGQDAIVQSTMSGLGVKSTGDTGSQLQLMNGEAFIVSFDTSNLQLFPRSRLVFSVQSNANKTYRVFQRTGEQSGTIAFAMASSLASIPTDNILVASGYQSSPGVYDFAIVDAGWNGGFGLRITNFSVGVVGVPSDYTAPSFNPLFTDNMMLQRDTKVKIYGTGTPGMSVTASFGAFNSNSAVIDSDGKWSVTIGPMPASYTPDTLSVSDEVSTSSVSNVLVGDVWLCSGQSNMDRGFNQFVSLSTAGLGNPFIRLVQVSRGGPRSPTDTLTLTPQLGGSWQESKSDLLEEFSPACYFFGARMEANNSVPMGLMHVAKGSTMIETWSSAETLVSLGIDPNSDDDFTRNYNGMIYPIRDFKFKGVLWYQGESNTDKPLQYGRQLSALITSWRTLFGRGDIPFYFAQLAAHGNKEWDLSDIAKPLMRDSQMEALAVNNTRMIVLMDAGEFSTIHPENKKAVGERFARHALIAEGHSGINVDSPTFKNLQIAGDKAIVTFDNVGGGLETRELKMNLRLGYAQGEDPQAFVAPADKVAGFQLAGPNQIFIDANAEISEGNKVVVTSPYIPDPVAVRYCYKWFEMCNLYASNDGLVAIPFRTDNFTIPNFEGNTTGTLFNGNYTSLGDPMIGNATFGTSSISVVTLFGVKTFKVLGGGDKFLYFYTNNTAFQNKPRPYVVVTILYYDQGAGIINFNYDVGTNRSRIAPMSILANNTKTWRVASVVLSDALFGNQISGYDVVLQSKSSMYIGGVYLKGVGAM